MGTVISFPTDKIQTSNKSKLSTNKNIVKIPVNCLIIDLEKIPGVTAIGSKEEGLVQIAMKQSNNVKELTAIVDVSREVAYLDSANAPKLTPPSYLQVENVLQQYGLILERTYL